MAIDVHLTQAELRQPIIDCNTAAAALLDSDPQSALKKARDAERLCAQAECDESVLAQESAQSFLIQAEALWALTDYGESLKCAHAAVHRSNLVSPRSSLHSKSSLSVASSYFYLGEYGKALASYQEAAATAKEVEDTQTLLTARNGIGAVHGEMGNYEQAIEHFRRCLGAQEDATPPRWAALYHRNICAAYRKIGQPEAGITHGFKLLEFLEQDNATTRDQISAYTAIGSLYTELDKFEQAERHYQLAEQLNGGSNANKEAIPFGIGYTEFLLKTERFDEAKGKLNHALLLAEKFDNKPALVVCYKLSAQVASGLGNFEEAYKSHAKFHLLQHELRSSENAKQIRNLQISHEVDMAQKQAEALRQQAIIVQNRNTELLALQSEKDEIYQIVLHDLRNPIGTALMTLELLQASTSTLSASKVKGLVENANSSLVTAFEVINQLAASVETESGNSHTDETAFTAFNVNDLVARVAAENKSLAESKNQQLVLGEMDVVELKGNSIWLKQIVSNLVSNAIKYSLPGSTTTLSLSADPDEKELTIKVSDEGLGFSAEDLNEIFTKFKTLSARPTGKESSTGLGLHITKTLTNRMGGTISVASEGKGLGSVFVVTLPLQI